MVVTWWSHSGHMVVTWWSHDSLFILLYCLVHLQQELLHAQPLSGGHAHTAQVLVELVQHQTHGARQVGEVGRLL